MDKKSYKKNPQGDIFTEQHRFIISLVHSTPNEREEALTSLPSEELDEMIIGLDAFARISELKQPEATKDLENLLALAKSVKAKEMLENKGHSNFAGAKMNQENKKFEAPKELDMGMMFTNIYKGMANGELKYTLEEAVNNWNDLKNETTIQMAKLHKVVKNEYAKHGGIKGIIGKSYYGVKGFAIKFLPQPLREKLTEFKAEKRENPGPGKPMIKS